MRQLISLTVMFPLFLLMETALAEPYPGECCPNYCAAMLEVTRILDDGNGEYVMTHKYGRLTVPASVERRQSPDGNFHICAGFTDHEVQVKCIFIPPLA